MPATKTGRQSSPAGALSASHDEASPSKTRVQPMRSARLRSPSPFVETLTSDAGLNRPSQVTPKKRARASPSKQASTSNTAAYSTRSRSRSVMSEDPSDAEDTELSPTRSSRKPRTASEEVDGCSSVNALENSSLQPTKLSVIAEADDDLDNEPAATYTSIHTDLDQLLPIATGNPSSSSKSMDDPLESSSESSASSESDSGDSDSDSGSDSDSDPDSDTKGEEENEEDLEALLLASQKAYKTAISPKAGTFADNTDMLLLNASTSKTLAPPAPKNDRIDSKRPKSGPGAESQFDKYMEALANGSLAEQSKKKSKHARTLKTSTGSNWFDMPEFGASSSKLKQLKGQSASEAGHSRVTGGDARQKTAEQLRQEVQAIRLRNALDPKRFYRASAKSQAMPAFAQLGKIIASPLEPKAVMSRKERGRTVVEELIRDAEAASYAKRKFGESQVKHRPSQSKHRSSKPPFKKRR